jgi:hypothetical protein
MNAAQVPLAQEDGAMVPLSPSPPPTEAAMIPRQLFAVLQQAAASDLNFRIQQATADGPLNITVSSTMNISVNEMNEVINSVGPAFGPQPQQNVSIIDVVSEQDVLDADHSLTIELENMLNAENRTMTPDMDITGHLIEEPFDEHPMNITGHLIEEVQDKHEPAVRPSQVPANPVRTQQGMDPCASTYGQASTDHFKSYVRMKDAVDPYPTSSHSPDKNELKAACGDLQMRMSNLREENRMLLEKSTAQMVSQQQVVASTIETNDTQREAYAAEVQRLQTLCNERGVQNEKLLQANCELENKKEQERKVIVDQATTILTQKDEQMQQALQAKDEQTRFALAQRDAQMSSALVTQENHVAKAAEDMQLKIQNYQRDNQQKDETITVLQKQMAAFEAKQASLEQELKSRSIPAPVFDSSDKQKDEEIRKLKEEKTAIENSKKSEIEKATLSIKIEKDKENLRLRKDRERLKEQCEVFQQVMDKRQAEHDESLKQAQDAAKSTSKVPEKKKKASQNRSSSEPPVNSTEDNSFTSCNPIEEEEEPECHEQEFDTDDQEDEGEYDDEQEDEHEQWPGWEWDDEAENYVRKSNAPMYDELSSEEKWMIAKQHEAEYIRFGEIPAPASGKILLWMIDNHERIAISSVIPEKATAWWKEAEDKLITCWKKLQPDKPWIKKFSQKVFEGLMCLIANRLELKARVDNIRTDLYKDNKTLSGRALYWIILHELRTSKNTHGLMNILDLQRIQCRGKECRHLKMFITHWQRCLQNFDVQPDESVLQPLFEKQVYKCDQFKHHFTLYEVQMMDKQLDRSYQRLYDYVLRFIEIETVKENDILATHGGNDGAPQWNMALYEQEMVKQGPGDCRSYFRTGKCNRKQCPYKHERSLPAWAKPKGKGKGKGKKGKGKGKKGKGKWGKDKGKGGKKGKDGKGKGKWKGKDTKGKGKGKKDKGKGKGNGGKWCSTCQKTSHTWKECWFNPNKENPNTYQQNWKNFQPKGDGKGRNDSQGPRQPWKNRSESQNSNQSANSSLSSRGLPNMCRNFAAGNCHLGKQCRFTHNPNRRHQTKRAGTPRGNKNQQNYMYTMTEQTSQGQAQQVATQPQPCQNEPQRVEITLLHSQPKA